MFDKVKFANILKKISNTYDNQRDFSKKSTINRTYLSQYINLKLDNPPKPEILEKLAKASNGITSYDELMYICGYIDKEYLKSYIIDNYNVSNDTYETALGRNIFDGLNESEAIALSKIIEDKENRRKSGSSDKSKYVKNLDENSKYKVINRYNNMLKAQMSIFSSIKNVAETLLKINESKSVSEKAKALNQYNNLKFYMCPVYGKISAGIPNWAEECLEGYLPIDPNLMGIISPEECFFLKVNGESMNKVIQNGAYALIRKQDVVENGEIAAVLVNGFEATLKKFTKQGELVILEPISDDPLFTTQVYNKDTDIKILGKYIGKFEMNK